MSDTYRNHLLSRVRGTPMQPVAQIAGNAARETAARIAVALKSPLTPSQYGGGGGGVVANDIMGQRGPVTIDPRVAGIPQRPVGPIREPGLPGSTNLSQGGSSDTIMSVPSGGYEGLGVYPPTMTLPVTVPPMVVPKPEPVGNRMRGAAGAYQEPRYDPYAGVADVTAEQEKITDLATGMTVTDPLVSAAQDPKGTAVELFKSWLTLSDIPRQWSIDKIGDALYQMATSDTPPDWLSALPMGATVWDAIDSTMTDGDKAMIIAAYNKGGGAGVWEDVIAAATDEMPWWVKYPIRAGTDILVDPLGYPLAVATGGAGVLAKGAIESAAAGDVAAAAAQKVAASLLGGPQKVLDYSIDAPFNAAGQLIGKAIRILEPTAKLLDEPAVVRETEQINLADEALGNQDRIRDGGGFEPIGGDDLDLPPTEPWTPNDPSTPRYTMASDGKQWIISDPSGKPVEAFPYKAADPNAAEPNYQQRLAQRRVNELNQPIIRREMEDLGAILPPEGELTWTDPGYLKLTNRGNRMYDPIQNTVAYQDISTPDVQRAWMDEWTPKAKEHETIMNEFRTQESNMMAKTGVNAEKDLVQRGAQLLYPRKTYELIRFYVDDTLLPFRESFPGAQTPQRSWLTSDTLNPEDANNLIEHAVLGTREDAIRARKILRQRNVSIEGFRGAREFVDHLGQMGERIHGPSWRSTDEFAVKSRGIRARQAAEPKIDEAAVSEIAGRKETLKERTNRINARTYQIQEAKEQAAKAAAKQTPEPDPVMDALIAKPAEDYAKVMRQLAEQDADEALVREITNPNTKSVTPGKNRIESKRPGEIVVKKPGSMKTNYVRIARSGDEWLLTPKEGETQVRLTVLSDAVAVADEILARAAKGIEPVNDQVKRVVDDLGVVSPGTARAINMEPGVSEDILRKAGAYEGPGASEANLLSKNDLSYVGAAHQMGRIDNDTYLLLSKWVTYENRQMRLWEAYDLAIDWLGDPAKAKQSIARLAVDADTAAELVTQQAARKARGGAKRALYKALGVYDGTLRFLREAIMFNWARGHASWFADMTGNAYTLAINGEMEAAAKGLDPRIARHFIQDERGKKLVIDNLPGMERYKYLTGTEPPPSVVQLVETRFETGHGSLVLEKTGPIYNLLRPIADRDIKALRTGFDRNNRFVLHMAAFDRNIANAQNQFRGVVATRAKRTGNDYVDWLRKLDQLGSDYNPDDVLRTFGDDRLARDWREMVSLSRKDAARRVDQLLFSYKVTNADNALRNIIFFHYWMSRAIPLHAKTAFKNPFLLNGYARAWERMEAEAEQNGYPPSVRGFIRMMGSKSGFYGLINPINVLVPFSMLVENNDDPGVFAFLKRWGLFINPLIEGAAAALGWTDTTPDLTGTLSLRRAIRYTVNWLNANGHENLVPNALGAANTWQPSVIDEMQYRVIETINKYALRAADALAPSQQIINDYQGSSRNAYEYDQLNSVLINELEKQYGSFETWAPESPVWQEYLNAQDDIAMGRDGNVLADSVVEQMADAKILNTFASAFIPGGVYQRYGPRDETLAESRAGEEQAWDQRDLATSGNPELTVDLQQLDRLGTENGRRGYALWNEIAFGDDIADNDALELNGQVIRGWQIKAMSDDQRKRLADTWLAQYEGVPAEMESYKALRADFLATNPEAGDFKEYQKGVGNYEGGISAWRKQYAIRDAAFADAMGKQEERLRAQGKTGDVLSRELDAWSMTPEAYNVANGMRDSIYDAPSDPKVPDYGFSSDETKTSKAKDPMTKIADDIVAYQEKLETAIATMRAAGYNVSAEDIYSASPLYADLFKAFDVPTPNSDVLLYLQWAQWNEGEDSVDAFIAYLSSLGQKAAA